MNTGYSNLETEIYRFKRKPRPQAKPKKRPNRLTISKRVRRRHRRAR